MPTKMVPGHCNRDCGGISQSERSLPGHDQKLKSTIQAKSGDLAGLKALVQQTLACSNAVKP